MIKLMSDLPDNVVGASVQGKVTGADYENVLIPAIEARLKTHKKIRLLYHLGTDFTDFDLAAIMDDSKTGVKHLFAWDRIAFVSDHQTVNTIAKFFSHLVPCEVRIFKNAELPQAKAWVSE